MKKNRIHIWLLLVPFFVSCTVQEIPATPEKHIMVPAEEFVPGKALLLLSEEEADTFNPTASPELLQRAGVTAMERVFPEAGEFEERHRAAGLHRWYKVSYDPNVSRTKAGNSLSSLPGVQEVVFEPQKGRRSYFNDPGFSIQWNFINDGTQGVSFKQGMDINIQPVWEEYTAGSQDVIVAVIDGGVQVDHEDLGGVVLTAAEGSRNFVIGHNPIQLLTDTHGTHVAGTIAAINNNGVGVSSIAGGRDGKGGVRILSCGIFSDDDDEDGDAEAALVWAADHGAVIANNSWGYVFDSNEKAAEYADFFLANETPLRNAIDYFVENAGIDARTGQQTGPMQGGLVLFASGNDGFTRDPMGEYSNVVAVGAFGPDGKMPRYSTYGPWVKILAPGGSDASNSNEWVLSLAADNKYAYSVGTSMACPHATGVAALLASYYGGPGYTVDQLKNALLNGAAPDVIDLQGRTVGGGKLDAYGAFAAGKEKEHPSEEDITFSTDYTGDWKLKSHESMDVEFKIGGNGIARLPVTCTSACVGVSASCNPQRVKVHIDALASEPGDYSITIQVGTIAQKTYPLTILANHAPQLVQEFEDLIVNAASAAVTTLDLSQYFSDPDGETLQFSVEADKIISPTITDNTLTFKAVGYGEGQVLIRAKDARFTSAEASFRLLARNTFQDMDVFPNPVSDWLNVRPANDRSVSVELVNAIGATVFSNPSAQAGPFNPLAIDMSGMPGGMYALFVNGERFTVVKR